MTGDGGVADPISSSFHAGDSYADGTLAARRCVTSNNDEDCGVGWILLGDESANFSQA